MVFSIDLNSALGLDRLCSKFYQFYWDIGCSDLLDVVLDHFRGSAMPRSFQSTLLVLLPKNTYLVSWVDFQLISLCNVSNKVLAKLFMLRSASLLPRIISPSQSSLPLAG